MPDINTLNLTDSKDMAILTPYSIVETDTKGRSLQANTNIAKGTRILSESPLLVIPSPDQHTDRHKIEGAVATALESGSLEAQSDFFRLHNAHSADPEIPELAGIMQTNVFELPGSGQVSVFREACMINHSCRPNCEVEWNAETRKINVHALQDLTKGTELTYDYLHGNDIFEIRRDQLQDCYNFTCACELCSLSDEDRALSDKMRSTYKQFEEDIIEDTHDTPGLDLCKVGLMLQIIKDDNMSEVHQGSCYYYATQLAMLHGDLARVKVFGQRAYRIISTFKGFEHPDAKKILHLLKTPNRAADLNWRTAVTDIPVGLDDAPFEQWLWANAEVPPGDELGLEDDGEDVVEE